MANSSFMLGICLGTTLGLRPVLRSSIQFKNTAQYSRFKPMAWYNRYNNSWWASEGDGPLTTGPDNPQLNSRMTILESLCGNGPLYAVETRFWGTKYGKVEVKDGRIYISSFQQEVPDSPVGTRFISFQELLSRFNNGSSELPTTVFFKMIPLADKKNIPKDEDSFEIIIETKAFTMIPLADEKKFPYDDENQRTNNFTMRCLALKGPSYKGDLLVQSRDFYYANIYEPPKDFIEYKNKGVYCSTMRKGGVYGVNPNGNWFRIQVEDHPESKTLPIFESGVVVKGLQRMKELQPKYCYVQESGLVI